jgi:starch synthase (maltosyl-transferring)
MLGTNGHGGMCRAHAHWGRLTSRYDALLAANLSPVVPEDRRILLARLRGWVVFQGFSQEIGPDCLDAFGFDFDSWGSLAVPHSFGTGPARGAACRHSDRCRADNAIEMIFYRHPAGGRKDRLADDRPVTLILRPDIEDRNFHEATKAFTGSEQRFPSCGYWPGEGVHFSAPVTTIMSSGWRRNGPILQLSPQWQYMVHHPQEAQRGQDPDSDLFSPGYFSGPLGRRRQRDPQARPWPTKAVSTRWNPAV